MFFHTNSSSILSFNCPVFTEVKHDADDRSYSCEYELGFYGIAATLLCFGCLLPITLLICCWAKWKNSKTDRRKLHRQDSDASTHTDISRPHDHGVYEVMRDDDGKELFFRTSKGGPYLKRYGTFSVPDLKSISQRGIPHTYPDVTQVEVSIHPSASGSEPQPKIEKRSNTLPPCIKRTQIDGITTERIDSYLKGVEDSRNHQTEQMNTSNKTKDEALTESLNKINFDKPDEFESSSELDGLYLKAETAVPRNIPVSKASKSEDARCHSASKQVTIDVSHFPSFQPTPPMKHLVDRVDFDQYLVDCVSKLPEDQKNGTFLIRDSQSKEGCKVLTIYFKDQDPVNTIYHYKVCFNEHAKAYIPGTKNMFKDLDEMTHFYRKQRTVLPCLLSNCLGKSF